jgi:hypothetical protein
MRRPHYLIQVCMQIVVEIFFSNGFNGFDDERQLS